MAWTYSGDPTESAKDAVRFLCGDTDQTEPLLQDGEIKYLLGLYNQAPLNAALRACEAIMVKFSRLADESVGSVKINYSQKVKSMVIMKEALKQRLATEDCVPFAGGISQAQKVATEQIRDRVKPDFTKHMMENDDIAPWTTGQNIQGTQQDPES